MAARESTDPTNVPPWLVHAAAALTSERWELPPDLFRAMIEDHRIEIKKIAPKSQHADWTRMQMRQFLENKITGNLQQ